MKAADHLSNLTFWYVYLLRCNDNSIYTGCTSKLEKRLEKHFKGEVTYTGTKRPLQLITYIVFTDKYKAYDFERYLKSGSGKAFSQKRLI
jgi:putative endonuclease